jgi:hypothetical protein
MRRNDNPNLNNPEWMRAQYATRTLHDIAVEIGCSDWSVKHRLCEFGIPLRHTGHRAVPASTEERFWSKVDRSGTCWLWTASLTKGGYGQFWFPPKRVDAHRASWMIANGPIPAGMCVCHDCDNPRCVRPDHLFLGTKLENTHDIIRKGRPIGRPSRS